MATATLPDGLAVTRFGADWWITHKASGVPLHSVAFLTKRDAAAVAGQLVDVAVDWTASAGEVRAAVQRLPGGMEALRRRCLPTHEIARRKAVYESSRRYLTALEADGQTVVATTSHGLAGTIYEMSCGCNRHFTVVIGGGVSAGEAEEDLLVRCDRHRELVIAAL